MDKCDFCGTTIPSGTGKMFVKKDGKVINFCSNKCEKNMLKLNRKPWNINWTEASKKKRGIVK
ncbi:MAG: 50S ribosomal protein L24e [bacterium]